MSEILSDVGEFGLIDRLQQLLMQEGVTTDAVSAGIGDDCAAFYPRTGYELLVTCDCMVERSHYLPEWISAFDLGRRAMVMNISDIGAMGGVPLYAAVSLGLRPDTPVAYVETVYRGFLHELNPFGASIIGGNLTKTHAAMFIDITLIGEVEPGISPRRTDAQPGDDILVTGHPGQSAAGLYLLLEREGFSDLSVHPLVQVYNTPAHRAREGRAVALTGCAHAMIDTSDGILGDLGHICQESQVGAELDQKQFPISEALRVAANELGRDPVDLFLHDSDDYELIITCLPENVPQIRDAIRKISDIPVTQIGRLTGQSEGVWLIQPNGTRRPIMPSGWDHFT